MNEGDSEETVSGTQVDSTAVNQSIANNKDNNNNNNNNGIDACGERDDKNNASTPKPNGTAHSTDSIKGDGTNESLEQPGEEGEKPPAAKKSKMGKLTETEENLHHGEGGSLSVGSRGGGDDDNNNVNEKHYELDDINFPLQYLQNALSKKKHPAKIEQQLKELSEKVKESVALTLAALDTQNDVMRNMFLYCLGRNLNDVFGETPPECLNCYFFNQGREYYAENKDELQNIYNNLHRNHNTTTTGEIDGCGIGNSSYTIKLLRTYREAGATGTVNFTSNYNTSLEKVCGIMCGSYYYLL